MRALGPNDLRYVIALSSESLEHEYSSFGIASLTDWPAGHERSLIIRHVRGCECFFRIAPIEDPTKFKNGGTRKGPAFLFNESFRSSSLATGAGLEIAEK